MPVPVVWSERDEPNSLRVYHCGECSGLMALIFGGKVNFARGIYSIAEREALKAAENTPDHSGSTLQDVQGAVHRRYGLDVHIKEPADLARYLDTPGYALLLQGKNGNLPPGDTLRRWDRAFSGNHAVCILTSGPTVSTVLWLDPEAPWRYKGQRVTKAKVKAWSAGLGHFIPVKAGQFTA